MPGPVPTVLPMYRPAQMDLAVKGLMVIGLSNTYRINLYKKSEYILTYFFVHFETTCANTVWNAIEAIKIIIETISHQSIIL